MEKRKRKPHHNRFPTVFVSAYSLEESVYRLELKQGKYIDTEVYVDTYPLNDDAYKFRLRGVKIGWHDSTKDVEVFGHLERLDEKYTRVVIEGTRMGSWGYTRIALLVLISLVVALLIVAFSGAKLLPLLPLIIMTAWILWLAQSNSGKDEVMRIVEDTLMYASEDPQFTSSLTDEILEETEIRKPKRSGMP